MGGAREELSLVERAAQQVIAYAATVHDYAFMVEAYHVAVNLDRIRWWHHAEADARLQQSAALRAAYGSKMSRGDRLLRDHEAAEMEIKLALDMQDVERAKRVVKKLWEVAHNVDSPEILNETKRDAARVLMAEAKAWDGPRDASWRALIDLAELYLADVRTIDQCRPCELWVLRPKIHLARLMGDRCLYTKLSAEFNEHAHKTASAYHTGDPTEIFIPGFRHYHSCRAACLSNRQGHGKLYMKHKAQRSSCQHASRVSERTPDRVLEAVRWHLAAMRDALSILKAAAPRFTCPADIDDFERRWRDAGEELVAELGELEQLVAGRKLQGSAPTCGNPHPHPPPRTAPPPRGKTRPAGI